MAVLGAGGNYSANSLAGRESEGAIALRGERPNHEQV